MDRVIYFIWALLPCFLFFIWARACFQQASKARFQEEPKDYFSPAVFSLVAMLLAIWIDKSMLDRLIALVPFIEINDLVARWLLYPAILLLMAAVHSAFHKRSEKAKQDAQRPPSKYA